MSASQLPKTVKRSDLGKVASTLRDAGWTNVAIGERFGTSEATVRRALREVGYTPSEEQLINRYEDSKRDFGVLEDLHIQCDDFIVMADLHLPITNYQLLNQSLLDAKARGIDTCIIAGDLLNMDALSRHEMKQLEDGDVPGEIAAANKVMTAMLETFDRVILTRGNHDERWARALQGTLLFTESMRLLLHEVPADIKKRLLICESDHVYVHTSEGKWLFCHSRSYSRVSGKVPADLAMIEMCNVAAGHRHHFGISHAPNGYQVIELGGFFDGDSTEYLNYYKTNFPKWQNGYVVFQDGKVAAMPPLINPSGCGGECKCQSTCCAA